MGAAVLTLFVTVQTVAGLVECRERGAAVVGQIKSVARVLGWGLSMGQIRRGRSRARQAKQSTARVPLLARFGMHCPGRIAPGSRQLLFDWLSWIATRLALYLPISNCPNKSGFEGLGRTGCCPTIQLEPPLQLASQCIRIKTLHLVR